MYPILHTNFPEGRLWLAKSTFEVAVSPGGFDTARITVLVKGGSATVATLFPAGAVFPGDGVQLASAPKMYCTGPEPGMETIYGIEPGSDDLTACTKAVIGYKGFSAGGSVWFDKDTIITYSKSVREIMFPQDTEGYILYGGQGPASEAAPGSNRFLRDRPTPLADAPFHFRVRQDEYSATVQGVWSGSAIVPMESPRPTLQLPPAISPPIVWANVPDPVYCNDTGWQEESFRFISEFKAGSIHLGIWEAQYVYIRSPALA